MRIGAIMSDPNACYLGDGAFVTFTGYDFVLTANHHDPKLATNKVHLEVESIDRLNDFVERMKREKELK